MGYPKIDRIEHNYCYDNPYGVWLPLRENESVKWKCEK
jgi:hypothetical protein